MFLPPVVDRELGEVADDVDQAEVLGRVDPGHAGLREAGLVALGDDPADDDGRVDAAICSAPLECPSSPGLPTSRRTGPPSSFAAACTRSRTSTIPPTGAAATAPTPVGARYSPNTSRSAPAHSPTVPPARANAS